MAWGLPMTWRLGRMRREEEEEEKEEMDEWLDG